MYCKNCGASVMENDQFCKNCGLPIGLKDMPKDGNTTGLQNSLENTISEENDFSERFIKAYMGSKADQMYESVKNGGVNIWGVLFGIGYFAYRKMYFVSVLIFIIGSIISSIVPSIGSYVGMMIGLMFCPLYRWDITRKLRKIKRENPTANEAQLLEMAKNKGGTSLIGAVLFFSIYIMVVVLAFYLG